MQLPYRVSYAEMALKFLTDTLLLLSISKVWLAQCISLIHKWLVDASESVCKKLFRVFDIPSYQPGKTNHCLSQSPFFIWQSPWSQRAKAWVKTPAAIVSFPSVLLAPPQEVGSKHPHGDISLKSNSLPWPGHWQHCTRLQVLVHQKMLINSTGTALSFHF